MFTLLEIVREERRDVYPLNVRPSAFLHP